MTYVKRTLELLKRFVQSFNQNYVPQMSECETPTSLEEAVTTCYKRGMLLVLNLTVHGKKVNVPLELPKDDFMVFTAPYNSKSVYDIVRRLSIDTLPFVGLFFCPTMQAVDMQLIIKIADQNDALCAPHYFQEFSRELMERRARYEVREATRNIVNEQDREYEEVLKEAQRREAEEARKIEEQRKLQEEIKLKRSVALKRHSSLPAVEGDPKDMITIRFLISGREPKTRVFLKTDKVSSLYDFVAIETAPKEPVLKFGFPTRTFSMDDRQKTLEEMKFVRRETVLVEDDEEEEDDE